MNELIELFMRRYKMPLDAAKAQANYFLTHPQDGLAQQYWKEAKVMSQIAADAAKHNATSKPLNAYNAPNTGQPLFGKVGDGQSLETAYGINQWANENNATDDEMSGPLFGTITPPVQPAIVKRPVEDPLSAFLKGRVAR